jgi:hypothetical protein
MPNRPARAAAAHAAPAARRTARICAQDDTYNDGIGRGAQSRDLSPLRSGARSSSLSANHGDTPRNRIQAGSGLSKRAFFDRSEVQETRSAPAIDGGVCQACGTHRCALHAVTYRCCDGVRRCRRDLRLDAVDVPTRPAAAAVPMCRPAWLGGRGRRAGRVPSAGPRGPLAQRRHWATPRVDPDARQGRRQALGW